MKTKVLKKTILVDLDGVLNEYTGNFDENYIPPLKKNADSFLKELSKNYKIKIFTTRNKLKTAKWLIKNNIDEYVDDITNIKELCWLYIDDRCLRFEGDYRDMFEKITTFKPYYKK